MKIRPFTLSFTDDIDNDVCIIVDFDIHNDGKDYTIEQLYNSLYDLCDEYYTNHIVLIGSVNGCDPLDESHILFTKMFLELNDHFDVTIKTKNKIEYIIQHNIVNFKYIICGRYNTITKKNGIHYFNRLCSLYDRSYKCLLHTDLTYRK